MINWLWQLIRNNIIMVIGLLLLSTLTIFITILKDNLKEKFKNIFRWIFFGKQETNIITSTEAYTKILNELIELRIKLNADRAYIFQFHNGEYFGNKNLRWKMSQTFETCNEGTTYEGKNLQNLDVTLFWDLIQIFYNPVNEINIPGVSIYRDNSFNSSQDCKFPKQIYIIDVKHLDGNRGFSKSLLIQQGVFYMLICPILNFNNEIIGFIGVDFCTENAFDEIINKKYFQGYLICQASSNIGLVWELDPNLRKKAISINKKIIKRKNA